jgi:hypothetical protein
MDVLRDRAVKMMSQETYHRMETAELNGQTVVIKSVIFWTCSPDNKKPNHAACVKVQAVSRKNFVISVCSCGHHNEAKG